MAEKSDDIKQLFSHLGLNPNDYHEIRSAPTANATVSEAPRRWSLLQAAAPQRHVQPLIPQTLLTAVAPVPVPVLAPAAAPRPSVFMGQSLLPAALLAAAEDILRAEAGGGASLRQPTATEQAPTREPVMAEPVSDLGLESLFQSVKEPQTAAYMPPLHQGPVRAAEPRTEMILDTPPPVHAEPAVRGLSFAERAAPSPKLAAAALPAMAEEPETRYSAPPQVPSRLGPVPMPPIRPAAVIVAAPAPAPVPVPIAPAAPGSGRLRFATGAKEPAGGHGNGESLQDVFRRLSRDNRA
ncbi:MAG: BcsR/BcsP family cellulose biosynthesis protein [Pseudomonadota bacterium]